MYKKDSVLNNLQELICHKTQPTLGAVSVFILVQCDPHSNVPEYPAHGRKNFNVFFRCNNT